MRTESIGEAGRKLGFDDYLRLSRGEKQGSDRAREQILANTFESVTGAIYLDLGYDAAKKFISDHILVTLAGILESGSWMDPKSRLQEVAQSIEGETPSYKVLEEEGPDHEKIFTIGIYLRGELRGQGTGHSKQAAQQSAAEEALRFYDTSKKG